MKLIKSFNYDLIETIQISKAGQLTEVYSVEVFAPRNNVFKLFSVIDTEYNKAKKNAEAHSADVLKGITDEQLELVKKFQNKEQEKEVKQEPYEIVNFMIRHGADISKCYEVLGSILTTNENPIKPSCLIDTQPMKPLHYSELSMQDVKNLLGLYIENFLVCNQNI
jgi:hypothetical protein